MVNPAKEKPLPLRFLCSDAFWEEEAFRVLPDSGLFHFTADIEGRPAAVIIDDYSLTNLVSIEVVDKLQLRTFPKKLPYTLAAYYDEAFSIAHKVSIPLTIYGHTVSIFCDVMPRQLTCCQLLLGKHWCDKFQVVFDNVQPDPLIFWNNENTWLAHTHLKKFQEVRLQNLCPPVISITKSSEHVDVQDESLSVHKNMGVEVNETCAVSTNVIISAPSVVSCHMQVAFEEREPPILQPASPNHALSLEDDVLVPTTLEENAIDIGIDLEPQPARTTTFCESTPLLVDSCDLTSTNTSEPCAELQLSNFDHVVLITHKEVLARIPPADIVCSIMLNKPLSLSCAMNKISEISYVNSSTYGCSFTFNLIGDYSMHENFMVDHICITCARIAELKLAVFSHVCYVPTKFCCGMDTKIHSSMKLNSGLVDILQPTKVILPMLDCSILSRIESDLSYPLCLSQNVFHVCATDLCFTYICKLSCILYAASHGHDRITILDWFDLSCSKFDHRSSVRILDLILNNKTSYIFVTHCHNYMNFTYTCNNDCQKLRYCLFLYHNCVLYTCNLRCILHVGNNTHVNKNDTTCYTYIYSAYTLFFLFLPLSACPKPWTAFLEEREDDEDLFMDYDDSACLNWKEILSQTDDCYKVNSLLAESSTLISENFIQPKSMHLCMIRFIDNTNIKGGLERDDNDGKHEGGEGGSGAIKDKNCDSVCQKSRI